MDQKQFLSELEAALAPLQLKERQDILRDQEEFFREALASGRKLESIISGLGDPKILAQTLLAQSKIEQAHEHPSLGGKLKLTSGAVLAVLALAPLNFFFVIGPLVIIVSLLFAGWTTVGSLGLVTLAVGGSLFTHLHMVPFAPLGAIAGFSGLLGVLGIVVMLGMLFWIISKVCLNLLLNYLRWNVRVVQNQMKGVK